MFGGSSNKLNQIEIFRRFGLIGKSITTTPDGGRTEDMKLYHIDFNEMTQTTYSDDEETRDFVFEDSELYSYFTNNEFLCILFEEPKKEYFIDEMSGKRVEVKHLLVENKFTGFKRLCFSDNFIDATVRKLWEDTRSKIMNNWLEDVPVRLKDGSFKRNKDGSISSAPNFLKSSQNTVFIRGGGADSSPKHKTECVNNIKMLPQFIWIKGSAMVQELGLANNE